MKDSAIYTMGSVSTTEVARALAQLLSRFSDQNRTAREMSGVIYGVSVAQHAVEQDLLRFAFLTPDGEEVSVEVDVRSLDRGYVDNLVLRVAENISEHRAKKVSTLTDVAAGVSRAVH